MSFNDFKSIPLGSVIRVVTTKFQDVFPGDNLTFVVKKGNGTDDWAIYCWYATHSVKDILRHGNKVNLERNIRYIMPCDDEMFAAYRY